MNEVLLSSFFDRPVLTVAPDLLGKSIVRRDGKKTLEGIITEVEAYDGPEDRACHAHRGRTPRNEAMFGPPGRWYVYFVYGMHWMLNVVTGPEGYPAAVLIRAVCTLDKQREWDGPAKFTKAFSIDGRFNGEPLGPRMGLWIEDRGIRVLDGDIELGPRIGVDYAGEWSRKPYRFSLMYR